MLRYREISETTARRVDRWMMTYSTVETLGELEERFTLEATKLLPADSIGWNNWATDWSGLISNRMNHEYDERFVQLLGIFPEVVENHPIIAAGQFPSCDQQVLKLSDFEAYGRFKVNPLFLEVYRHLDSHYQICYAPSLLSDRRILLTWNRRALDFTEQDRQMLHLIGSRLNTVAQSIETTQRLTACWQALIGFVDARLPAESIASLGAQDGKVLAGLLNGQPRMEIARENGIRRDSLDKRLGSIRERLGLENHHQLVSALAELKKKSP